MVLSNVEGLTALSNVERLHVLCADISSFLRVLRVLRG